MNGVRQHRNINRTFSLEGWSPEAKAAFIIYLLNDLGDG
jgi:hypothetical protein